MAGKKTSGDEDSKPRRVPPRGAGRRPGRPPANEKGGVSRQGILQAALKLSKSIALQDLSIVVVARSMDVTPALIHYYIGGRDWLTSGIMNLFYKNLLKRWPEPTGDWEQDVPNSAKALFDHLVAHPGIAAYLVSNHRFRIYQLTAFGDRDYGAEVLNRFAGHVRAAGLSAERMGLHSQLMLEFVMSMANCAARHIFPSEHREFFEDKIAKMDPVRMENIIFGKVAPLELNADSLFKEGMSLYMLAIQRDRAIEGVSDSAKPALVKLKGSTK